MNVDVHSHIVDRQYLDDLVSTLGLETESTGDGKRLFRRNGCTVGPRITQRIRRHSAILIPRSIATFFQRLTCS
jgi:hypothetical protein